MSETHEPFNKGLGYYLYNGATLALSPVIAAILGLRLAKSGKSRVGRDQRFGHMPEAATKLKESGDPIIWMHAVSVGEVAAAEAILAEVRRLAPLARVVLSTTTQTGQNLAASRDLNVDALVYLPLDLPWVVRRALDGIRPDLLVTIDTELWPNLFGLAHLRGVRTAVANARFSDKGMRRTRPFKPIYRWTLRHVDAVLAQSELDAERYRIMGAPADRVEVTGSAKFDEDFPEVRPAELAKLRQDLGLSDDMPTWVVGSTREGEEVIILDALRQIRIDHAAMQLVVAPRHPERGDEIEALVTERGYHAVRRSRMLAGDTTHANSDAPQDSILILDTIGELAKVYALADIATVGGSFVKWGGHNMLQPMAQGKPVIVGPHTHNFRDIVSVCKAEEAMLQLSSPDELAATMGRLLSSPGETELLSVRARKVVQANLGASARTAQRLVELLDRP